MSARHTTCKFCGQDIEGVSPYRKGEWRDRGNNRHCPPYEQPDPDNPGEDRVQDAPAGQLHAPVIEIPRRVKGAMHHRVDGQLVAMPNTLQRRTAGQCPYCLHYGTNCRCHIRKTMPISKIHERVYLVIEEEPETSTEYPSVVVGVYRTKQGAEDRVAYERKVHRLEDDATYMDSDLSWEIEIQELWP